MTAKLVIPREQAREDVDKAVENYLETAGPRVTTNLVEQLERAYTQIASYPAAGSPRFAYELGVPNLRHVRINGFPYLIFYVELAAHIDVWRVLHAKRDIPAWLEDPDLPPM
ncbi:type II toxin-antitoxin system RelE/ParE family toxin [Mesorhizobium shangrilense]|uniref:Type II toxin-antitoxin system RelE/ParE family toxin n=1 Tax=Mesorhizobium shangrilense TaxID=460060 RepID=A0ABV2DQL4_9HYPH